MKSIELYDICKTISFLLKTVSLQTTKNVFFFFSRMCCPNVIKPNQSIHVTCSVACIFLEIKERGRKKEAIVTFIFESFGNKGNHFTSPSCPANLLFPSLDHIITTTWEKSENSDPSPFFPNCLHLEVWSI